MPPLAHAGHWLASLLYLAPVVIVIAVLAWQSRRERGRGGTSEEDDDASLADVMTVPHDHATHAPTRRAQ